MLPDGMSEHDANRERDRKYLLSEYNRAIKEYGRHKSLAHSFMNLANDYAAQYEAAGFAWPEA